MVNLFVNRLGILNAVLLHVFPPAWRAFAVAHTALDIGNLFFGQILVSWDKMLTPEWEILDQFTRVIEIEADSPKGVGLPMHFNMAAATDWIRFGNRLGKAHVEQCEQNVGTVADVIPGTLPLNHGLMQDTGSIEIRIQMVAIIDQTVVTLVFLGLTFDRIVEQMLITGSHIKRRGRVFHVFFDSLGSRDLDTVYAVGELRLDTEHFHRAEIFLEVLSVGVE